MQPQAVLLVTYRSNEKYLDRCVAVLHAHWPGHAPIWVLSDRGAFGHPDRIVTPSPNWVEVVQGGLDALRARRVVTDDGYVALVLEDHVPVAPLPAETLSEVLRRAEARGLPFVGLTGHGRGDAFTDAGGLRLYPLREDFAYYSELHPVLWRVSHLRATLATAKERGALDPWSFEKVRLPGIVHFTTGPLWPFVWGGFLIGGRVNLAAVRAMRGVAVRPLRQQLIREWLLGWPSHTWARLVRRLRRLRAGTTGGQERAS